MTAEDFSEAANLFLSMHDFDLAENYYTKAQLAGANSRTVAIGLTNTYLAEGDTQESGVGAWPVLARRRTIATIMTT